MSGRILVGYGGNDEIAVYDDDMTEATTVALGLPSLTITRRDKMRFADSLSQVLEDNVTRSDVGPSEGARMRALNPSDRGPLDFPSTHPRYVDRVSGRRWTDRPRNQAPSTQDELGQSYLAKYGK